MNFDTYQNYVIDMVNDSIRKGGGSATEALQWLQQHQSSWKTILFTPNPTKKSTAFRDVEKYFNGLSISDNSSKTHGSLNPDIVIYEIVKIKLQNIFFTAKTMSKMDKNSGINIKLYKKEAKEAIRSLEKMGYEGVSVLKQSLDED
jgi:hypothetical protein